MMYLRYDEHVRALARAAMPSYKALNLTGDARDQANRRFAEDQKVEGTGSHRADDSSPVKPLGGLRLGGFLLPCAPTPAGASKSHVTAPSTETDAPATNLVCVEDGCEKPHNGSWCERCDEHATEYYEFEFNGCDL